MLHDVPDRHTDGGWHGVLLDRHFNCLDELGDSVYTSAQSPAFGSHVLICRDDAQATCSCLQELVQGNRSVSITKLRVRFREQLEGVLGGSLCRPHLFEQTGLCLLGETMKLR